VVSHALHSFPTRRSSDLKGVAVVMHGKDQATLTLTKKGPGVVTAGDIQLDHDVEIKNPDHVIANLTGNTELKMRLTVARGRGYQDRKSTRLNSSHVKISY